MKPIFFFFALFLFFLFFFTKFYEMKHIFSGLIPRLKMAKGRVSNRKTGQQKL